MAPKSLVSVHTFTRTTTMYVHGSPSYLVKTNRILSMYHAYRATNTGTGRRDLAKTGSSGVSSGECKRKITRSERSVIHYTHARAGSTGKHNIRFNPFVKFRHVLTAFYTVSAAFVVFNTFIWRFIIHRPNGHSQINRFTRNAAAYRVSA